jgi:hypothetical protein
MVLDDDALLLSESHASSVMRLARDSTTETLLLQPTFVGPAGGNKYTRKAEWPQSHWRDRTTAHWRVDMSNLVFHKSMARHIDLSHERCGGDKEIMRQLLRANATLRPLSTDSLAIGVWANYGGARSGKSSGVEGSNFTATLLAAAGVGSASYSPLDPASASPFSVKKNVVHS